MAPITTLRNLILAALLCAISTTARSFQVNYYYDGGCSDYASQAPNVPNNAIYNWSWGGSGSANIANCDGYDICYCIFYTQPNGGGSRFEVDYGVCASNWPNGFKSFVCQYEQFKEGKRIVEGTAEGNL
jgi:hypothetical protein